MVHCYGVWVVGDLLFRRLHSPPTERIREHAEITPSVKFCQTQKKAPRELAILLLTSPNAPDMCRIGIPVPMIAPSSRMMYPDRRPDNASAPYTQPARTKIGMTILSRPGSIPR